jgi:hypothetical protein
MGEGRTEHGDFIRSGEGDELIQELLRANDDDRMRLLAAGFHELAEQVLRLEREVAEMRASRPDPA